MDKTSFSIPMDDFNKLPAMTPAEFLVYLKSRGRLRGFPMNHATAVTVSFRPNEVIAYFITPEILHPDSNLDSEIRAKIVKLSDEIQRAGGRPRFSQYEKLESMETVFTVSDDLNLMPSRSFSISKFDLIRGRR